MPLRYNSRVQVFLNGRFVPESRAVVPVNDRGFLLGDGLFETVRVRRSVPFQFAQHLERLARGADFLKIKLPFPPAQLELFAARLIQRNRMPDAVLRLTLTRGPGERGYLPRGHARPTLAMTLHPAPKNPPAWKLATSSFRLAAGDPLAGFKTTSKILNVLARIEASQNGADEALLLNTRGEAVETAGGNLFWIHGGEVCTPPVGRGALPGVTREVVLEISRSLGCKTAQRAIRPARLRRAAGIFVTQSVFGVVPVTQLDGVQLAPSPLVNAIRRAYDRLLVSGQSVIIGAWVRRGLLA